jgi:hypothetical protein
LPDFKRVFDVLPPFLLTPEKWAYWLRLNSGGGQIRPGVRSRKQGHGLTVRRFPAGELESKWKSWFADSTENSEEPSHLDIVLDVERVSYGRVISSSRWERFSLLRN